MFQRIAQYKYCLSAVCDHTLWLAPCLLSTVIAITRWVAPTPLFLLYLSCMQNPRSRNTKPRTSSKKKSKGKGKTRQARAGPSNDASSADEAEQVWQVT